VELPAELSVQYWYVYCSLLMNDRTLELENRLCTFCNETGALKDYDFAGDFDRRPAARWNGGVSEVVLDVRHWVEHWCGYGHIKRF
jgi:hypothetical protein